MTRHRKHRQPRPLPFHSRGGAIRFLRRAAGGGTRDEPWETVITRARIRAGRDRERQQVVTIACRRAGVIEVPAAPAGGDP